MPTKPKNNLINVRKAKNAFSKKYLVVKNNNVLIGYINGVGITGSIDNYKLKVCLVKPLPKHVSLPAKFKGFPVVSEVVGVIKAQ